MMQQILVAATAALLLTSIYLYEQHIDEFEQWQQQHQKFYAGIERTYREKVYYDNKRMIQEHNNNPSKTYTMKENQFMTITNEEFIGLFLNQIELPRPQIEETLFEQSSKPLKAVNWTNYLTVKSQGNCNSGWAFSVSNSVEALYIIQKQTNVSLSTQQIIDCDTQNYGCYSGNNYYAMQYVTQYGLMLNSSYPYAEKQQACKYQRGVYKIQNFINVGRYAYTLQSYLLNHPVSVGVDARNWQHYGYGIFVDCGTDINHYALAVGFDYNQNWIVQNSWGYTWGQNGTIVLGPGNTCGILDQAYQVY